MFLETLELTPWFRLYCKTFVNQWWTNLDNYKAVQNLKSILRLTPIQEIPYLPEGDFDVVNEKLGKKDENGNVIRN